MPSFDELNLNELYGDNFRKNFDPYTHNIRTGETSRGHHCRECESIPSKRCYFNMHWAFCLVPYKAKDGQIPICGERFAVKSAGGCGKHHFNEDGGLNRIFKEAKRGKKLADFSTKLKKDEAEQSAEQLGNLNVKVDENDFTPWKKYESQPTYNEKLTTTSKTGPTKKRQQPAPTYKTVVRTKKTRKVGKAQP